MVGPTLGCPSFRVALLAFLCAAAAGERPSHSGNASSKPVNRSGNASSNASASDVAPLPSSALQVALTASKSGEQQTPPEGYSAETFGEVALNNESLHEDGAKVIMYPRVHWQTRPKGPIHQVVNRLRMFKKHLEAAEDQARDQASTYAATLRKLGKGIDIYRKGPEALANSVQRHQNEKLEMVEQAIKEGGKQGNEEDFQAAENETDLTGVDHTNQVKPVKAEAAKKDSNRGKQDKSPAPNMPKVDAAMGHESSGSASSES